MVYSRMTALKSGSARLLKRAVPPLLMLAIAFWSTAESWQTPTTTVAVPPHGARTVALFNVWTMLWNSRQLSPAHPSWWDAPMFHPEQGTFAWSEPQPFTFLFSPLLLCGQGALAYNMLLLLSLTLNGLLTLRLLRLWGIRVIPRLAAGIAIILLPMLHDQLDVLQLTAIWPFIWLLSALTELRKATTTQSGMRGVLLRGGETGLAFCTLGACSVHHALFTGILLAVTVWLLVPWRHLIRWSAGITLASAMVLLLLGPLLLQMQTLLRQHRFERATETVERLSVDLIDFAVQTPGHWLLNNPVQHQTWSPMSPGFVRSSLALGCCLLLMARMTGRLYTGVGTAEVCFLLLLSAMSGVFAIGMHLGTSDRPLWPLLTSIVPGLSHVRSPFRFGYFFQLAQILLAACSLDQLQRIAAGRTGLKRVLPGVLLVVCCGITAFEILPRPLVRLGIPNINRKPEWASLIRSRQREGQGTLILPHVMTSKAADFEPTVRWMIQATAAQIPLANGYSGFFPPSHYKLQRALQQDRLTQPALQLLRNRRIRFLVTFNSASADWVASAPPGTIIELQKLSEEVTVFEVTEAPVRQQAQ